ncbi:hypothetical protein RHGRI_033606 [Rhododendron griersonianum]|uniref:Uncharacterized protein n=1 Tax=Rhododendron griersonianum TaxID=479676 RepID=A0AAV6I342_9ERIC|nr:hypothetical protein RHGRI_033606 [Rhododendron griersonianum]
MRMLLPNVATERTSSAVTPSGKLNIALRSFLGWLRALEMVADIELLNKTKTLGLFAERFCSNVAMKDVIPKAEKLVELYQLDDFQP